MFQIQNNAFDCLGAEFYGLNVNTPLDTLFETASVKSENMHGITRSSSPKWWLNNDIHHLKVPDQNNNSETEHLRNIWTPVIPVNIVRPPSKSHSVSSLTSHTDLTNHEIASISALPLNQPPSVTSEIKEMKTSFKVCNTTLSITNFSSLL